MVKLKHRKIYNLIETTLEADLRFSLLSMSCLLSFVVVMLEKGISPLTLERAFISNYHSCMMRQTRRASILTPRVSSVPLLIYISAFTAFALMMQELLLSCWE